MVLDRRRTLQIAQALLRAQNANDGNNILKNVVQSSTASRDGSYDKPVFGGKGFLSALQSSVATDRSDLFRRPTVLPYSDGIADIAKPHRIPAHDQFAFGAPPNPPSRPANLPTSYGRPGGTTSASPRATTFRVADGDVGKLPARETKMPKVHYKTSGEIWSDFLGGIGKGIAQSASDWAYDDAKRRLAEVEGIYIDTPNPVLFDPPTSSWDSTGRQIAPAIAVVTRLPPRQPTTWNGKIIGRITPPPHLKPGTTPFGNYMHKEIAKFLKESYPKSSFVIRVEHGQRGPDLEYQPLPGDIDPGFKISDIKTNKAHSEKQLNNQIENWGYEQSDVRVFSYDDLGNIYDGFGQ